MIFSNLYELIKVNYLEDIQVLNCYMMMPIHTVNYLNNKLALILNIFQNYK